MFKLWPYTRLYNELSQWSVSGFLPPNWAWWAWHLIGHLLWESHYLKAPQWQFQWKILRINLVKCHTTLSHVAQKLCGYWSVPVNLRKQNTSTYTTMGFTLHLMIVLIMFPNGHSLYLWAPIQHINILANLKKNKNKVKKHHFTRKVNKIHREITVGQALAGWSPKTKPQTSGLCTIRWRCRGF